MFAEHSLTFMVRETRRYRPIQLDQYRAWFQTRWPRWQRVGRSNLSRDARRRRAIRQRTDPGRHAWLRRDRAARALQRFFRSRMTRDHRGYTYIQRRRARAALLRMLAARQRRPITRGPNGGFI